MKTMTWYSNGMPRTVEFIENDVLHSTTGPAYAVWDMNGNLKDSEYWVNGNKIPQEIFDRYGFHVYNDNSTGETTT